VSGDGALVVFARRAQGMMDLAEVERNLEKIVGKCI